MPHHFNSAQNTRENLLAQLKTMNEEKISVLKNERQWYAYQYVNQKR